MRAPAVLVTRPRHQAARLSAALRRRGMEAVEFPLLRILPASDPMLACQQLDALADASVVIFVSANGVREALRLRPCLLQRIASARVAALGGGTVRALEEAGYRSPVITPEGTSTESLLELSLLRDPNVRGIRVGLVKGEGGRPLMARTLRARGAQILSATVYRRAGPGGDLGALLAGRVRPIRAAILTSVEALENLARLAAGAQCEQALNWPLVVSSERVANKARQLGFRAPIAIVTSMSDECIADTSAGLLAADMEDV